MCVTVCVWKDLWIERDLAQKRGKNEKTSVWLQQELKKDSAHNYTVKQLNPYSGLSHSLEQKSI